MFWSVFENKRKKTKRLSLEGGVTWEPQVEELLWGFVGREGVYVVEVDEEGGGFRFWVGLCGFEFGFGQ